VRNFLTFLLFCWAVFSSNFLVADDRPFITWFNPPRNQQPGVEHKGYHSKAMNREVGYNIYLPPGYAASAERYRVIYWLHGRNGSESYDQFPVRYLDEGIRKGALPPMILVYANGGSQSFYSDSFDGKWPAETTLIKELIPHIDATQRTIAARDGRAIQGMSMGGFGALKLGFKYPGLFSSVIGFAGGYLDAGQIKEWRAAKAFATIFNNDTNLLLANHPATFARAHADKIRGRLAVRMYCGTADRLLENNRAMHRLLEELKIPHEYVEFDGIGHNLPKLAEQVKGDGFAFAARHFKLPTPR